MFKFFYKSYRKCKGLGLGRGEGMEDGGGVGGGAGGGMRREAIKSYGMI